MKTFPKVKLYTLTVLLGLVLFATSCKTDEEVSTVVYPKVTTISANATSPTSASCEGKVTSDGGASVTARGACWSTSNTPTVSDNRTIDGTGTGNFTSTLANLVADNTYYVRAYATNSAGTGYGNALSFITTSVNLPMLTTSSVTAITQTTAVCGGSISSDGGSDVTQRGVCWSTSQNPTLTDNHTNDGSGIGVFASNLTGLSVNTNYYVRVYAINNIGTAYGNQQIFATLTGSTTCGESITITHVASAVAPVDKTVTYGTVTNIPGEHSKCWITSNLGADHQATAVDDTTEASAGWYWQFNRKQGYKHDGSTLTPAWTITSISEDSDWISANDPCTLELGNGWRLPTNTEWTNVAASGSWTTWSGPWNSGLKLYAAGCLGYSNGSLGGRGSFGYFWSSVQHGATTGWDLSFGSSYIGMSNGEKVYGLSVRCIRD
jgi:uncharacterized protein (TIGR02145 family)